MENSSDDWFEQSIARRVAFENSKKGSLSGDHCDRCNDKGIIYAIEQPGNYELCYECECMLPRRAVWAMQQSGLSDLLDIYTFDTFKMDEAWQRKMGLSAARYASDPNGWFFVGGQPGSGKTHICTAICGELLKSGRGVKYMTWVDEIRRITGAANDFELYEAAIDKYKNADVLYIDDLYKPVIDDWGKKKPPSPGTLRATFEIINHRYMSRRSTIISTEHSITGIMDIDEATGSRIYERAKDFCIDTGQDGKRNYRMG